MTMGNASRTAVYLFALPTVDAQACCKNQNVFSARPFGPGSRRRRPEPRRVSAIR
ncbi:hypothetical protein SAMN05519103_08508 [Rhizobiales bacterium GAS113]|nr:hypothetical protein SAMN05519103_08508 [Rhizobiales bacterium GAS113]